MSRNSPRLTNVMYFIAALEKAVRYHGKDTNHPEPFRGTRLAIVYITLVMRRYFRAKPLGWPIHLEKFRSLIVQVGFSQAFWLEWEIGNDLPEDDLLVGLRSMLEYYMDFAESRASHSTRVYEMIDHKLYTCVRDHLKRNHDDGWLKTKLDEIMADKEHTRDYLNIWTTPGATTE